jgi:hypothetical protein
LRIGKNSEMLAALARWSYKNLDDHERNCAPGETHST